MYFFEIYINQFHLQYMMDFILIRLLSCFSCSTYNFWVLQEGFSRVDLPQYFCTAGHIHIAVPPYFLDELPLKIIVSCVWTNLSKRERFTISNQMYN